jgi:threonine dehydrogenase-like Zn-dependent dehydrogenase
VDKVPSRIELAKSLGATDGFDTTGIEELVPEFKKVAKGLGPNVVVDSSSYPLISSTKLLLALTKR